MPNLTHKLLQEFREQPRMQAGSLIVSVFGDAIHPRGGGVWLGCLIRLLEPLALNERLIRTAIFRLVKEDWLTTQTLGRRTDYGLSNTGRQRIEDASKLIYGGTKFKWDEQWRMMLANPEASSSSRAAMRKALTWRGFGEWSANTYLHPSADLNQVLEGLQSEGLAEPGQWVTLMSKLIQTTATATVSNQQVVEKAWDLKRLGLGYLGFIQQYLGIQKSLAKNVTLEEAFLLRILLVHDFRRLLLRDPMLPDALLPANWPGLKARQLFNSLYLVLQVSSEKHLDAQLKMADGSTPRRSTVFSKRIAAMRAGSKS